MKKFLPVFGLLIFAVHTSVLADYSQRDDVQQFISEMVQKHGFDRAELNTKFAEANRLDGVLEAIAKPAEKVLTWKQYRPIFVKQKRIDLGNEFLQEHQATLARAEKEYGVPAEIITAVIGVETYYGRHKGKTDVFDSLVTLGFDYPPRAKFFRKELEQFLLLAREEGIDPRSIKGSYAGAMGMPQFISSSYRHYAVDFDGDGKRDLWSNTDDVIGSVANYFKLHKWVAGEPVVIRAQASAPVKDETRNKLKPHTSIADFARQGVQPETSIDGDEMATLVTLHGNNGKEYWLGLNNFYSITRYNHSALYAMAVYQLSLEFDAQ